MWSPFVLCLLVGFAYASTSPAWKENTEYVYLVKGRTLSSLHEAADHYSGILLKAKLYVTPRLDGKLQGRIADAQYSQLHTRLPGGWKSEVPESQLSYKQLPLSLKPFQMILEDGSISKLIVENGVTNWEANIIKSILSQFQLDIQGRNAIDSPINNLPTSDKFNGVFKTMEKTVTGKTETLYEIHPLPKYLLLSQPQWPLLKEDDQIVEVIKFKNYTNAEQRPSYHYGFADIKESEPTSNRMGQFFVRESYSQAVLTGQLTKFVIQTAYTVNKIFVNPTFKNKEMGSIISMVNVTLSKLTPQSQEPQDLSDPIEIGDLVYTYENPFTASKSGVPNYAQFEEDFSSRNRRSIDPAQFILRRSNEQSLHETYQLRPEMKQAPEFPFLPYHKGYKGSSIKNDDFDVKQKAKQIINEIIQEVQDPQKILVQFTMNKFTILATCVRLMNKEEIQSVAEEFYNESPEDQQSLPWKVFIDALAEAGTGPAFLTIREFIESGKIKEFQAAEIVGTMSRAVRVPTEEYMRNFYELTKDPKVKEQKYLNETAILSFTDLVYEVYIRGNQSHNQFPVHSFGSFYTKEGTEFVTSTVIPYLSQQLHDAISQADSRKIHVYIRALGNVAHPKCLEAFEPYLEGQKQASQFQRMLMVTAFDRLVESYPIVARSVSYKLYQNVGEIPEVRIVAVSQIMKTNPPVEMLQRMAESTHTETQEQVVAAIKSAIETAALLKSPEHQHLQQAAASAKPLLIGKIYAGDNSFIDLRDYIMENMDMQFYHKFLQTGSQDNQWPKTIKLAVRGNLNGMYNQYYKVSAMASSVTELLNVLYRQTEEYQQAKSQRFQRTGDSKWSSANIAELLNYETEEREQLEAVIIAEMDHFQKLWSIDNQTLDLLPDVVREQEELLKNGKQINYNKFRQVDEKALSFPTEMGIPFLFTYDIPLLVRIEGHIKAIATPQISSNNKLHKPEQISGKVEAKVTVSGKVQSHLSFLTPFDHQEYMAGFDKNLQAYLPINANVLLNIKDKQAQIQFEMEKIKQEVHLFHYSTLPYTSRSDISDISPVALRSHTEVIKPKVSQYRYFDVVLGKKETGMAFRVSGYHPAQFLNFREVTEIFQSHGTQGIANVWEQLWDKAVVQQTEANIAFIPSQSSVRKVTLRLGKQGQYKKEPEIKTEEEYLTLSQLSSKLQSEEPKVRQEEMIKHVSSGIKSAKSSVYDVSVEFKGDKKYEHILGVAVAKSDAGPKSRTVIYYKKNANEVKQFAFQVKGYIPNTNGLDLTYSLKTEPQAKYEVRVQYGKSEDDASSVSGQAEFTRSQARKQYLVEQEPMYQVCKKQMQEGNFQLPACQNLTILSNYLDDIKIDLKHDMLRKEHVNIINGFFETMRVLFMPMTEIKFVEPQKENEVSLRIQFQPENFGQVNLTVRVRDEETKMFNLTIFDHIVKALVVPHPVFHLKSRFIGVLKGMENFRPTCVIDQTAAQTFSNRTYPLSMEDKFTVLMQYIPREARLNGQSRETVKEILNRHLENYVVLARKVSAQQQELLITFNHKETGGKTVEINVKPRQLNKHRSASNPAATVLVDNQEVHFTDEEIADVYNGIVQIYALPNGEVKLEFNDVFYLIFDGQRVKMTATGSTLLDSTTGLCGRFSKDQFEDFTVPSNCVVRNPIEFIRSYVAEASRIVPRSQHSYEFNSQCVRKVMPLYADVISDRDAERQTSPGYKYSGTQLRQRYFEDNGETCFTILPVPMCNQQSSRVISKKVPVHCIEGSKIAYYLKNQIDQGGNPDFSHKPVSRKISIDVPLECN